MAKSKIFLKFEKKMKQKNQNRNIISVEMLNSIIRLKIHS
jgi:hypothetical protein